MSAYFWKIIFERHSIRSYLNQSVSLSILERIQHSITHFKDALVIIIPFLVNKLRDKKQSEGNRKLEEVIDIQSVAVAVGNLLLAVTASGLGARWYVAPLFCSTIVTSCLHVDHAWRPQALITLGYQDEIPRTKAKKSLKEIMTCV
jgi:nitroreductase